MSIEARVHVLDVSAPSPGDDLSSKSAIRLRGQKCTQRYFEGFVVRPPTLNNCERCPQACPDSRRRLFFCGNNTVAVAMRSAMKMAKVASRCGNSLRFRLQFKKSC